MQQSVIVPRQGLNSIHPLLFVSVSCSHSHKLCIFSLELFLSLKPDPVSKYWKQEDLLMNEFEIYPGNANLKAGPNIIPEGFLCLVFGFTLL